MAIFTTAARTWAVGETVTAANLNAQLRDLVSGFGGWTSYTPSWASSGTAPVLGNGSLTGQYTQVGKMVWFRAVLAMGSTTTYGTGNYIISLPASTPSNAYQPIATATISGTSGLYLGTGYVVSSTTIQFLTQPAAGLSAVLGATSPITWASGNQLVIAGTYQAA